MKKVFTGNDTGTYCDETEQIDMQCKNTSKSLVALC